MRFLACLFCLSVAATGYAELGTTDHADDPSAIPAHTETAAVDANHGTADSVATAGPRVQSSAGPHPAPLAPTSNATSRRDSDDKHWYGLPILAIDFASVLIPVTLASKTGSGVVMFGAGAYVLGGPIVHLAHENPGAALGSLGLRVALPITAALLGYELAGGSERDCPTPLYGEEDECSIFPKGLGGAVLGFGVGVVAATVIDIGLLAYDHPKSTPLASMRLAPLIDPQHDAAGLSVFGVW